MTAPTARSRELTRTLPRIDVIAGASAGGINGAVLAVAIAHGSQSDGSVNLDGGRLDRGPAARSDAARAASLFYGDQKLLTALGAALKEVAGEGDSEAVGDHPLHLTVTGTR